jgi:prevent-host-death family protein
VVFEEFSSNSEEESQKMFSRQVKPIGELKARATEIIRELSKQRVPVVITINGEARAVLQDVASYEETQESLALLKILALSNKNVAAGRVRSAKVAFGRLRRRTKAPK